MDVCSLDFCSPLEVGNVSKGKLTAMGTHAVWLPFGEE